MSLSLINKRLTLISDNLQEERNVKLRRKKELLKLKKSIKSLYKQWDYFWS